MMGQATFSTNQAKEYCIEGSLDLMLYLKKLLQKALDDKFNADELPSELVSAYNQLIILLNNSISGLRLPATMIRSMLNDIRTTLKDHKDSENSSHTQLIDDLEVATNMYICLANSEQNINIIAQKYKGVM